ncbi:MAG: hypothetical protein LJE84_11530 [Gammaproteobacteria bacterium]|nr:hypothetical protein [Gammaproteobacteria bacterium]
MPSKKGQTETPKRSFESASGDTIDVPDFITDDDSEDEEFVFERERRGSGKALDARMRLERLLERKSLARTISDDLYTAELDFD